MTTPTTILEAVSTVFPVTPADILGPRRRKNEAEARHLAMWLCHSELRMSNSQVAKVFNRDTSATVASRRAFLRFYETDRQYRGMADSVIAALGAGKPVMEKEAA